MNRRQVLQVAILLPMIALAIVADGVLTGAVAIALPILALFQIAVWLHLRSKHSLAVELGYDLPTLRERVDASLTLALASLAGGTLGMIVVLRGLGLIGALPRWVFLVGLAYILIVITVPAIGWLRLWRDVWLPNLRRKIAAKP